MTMMSKSYSEMCTLESYDERLAYLKLGDNNATSPRHISMDFYKSKLWAMIREEVIFRDMGFDLACINVDITGHIIIHHINPIDENDILYMTPKLTDPENLVCTSLLTHNLIHYNNEKNEEIERSPEDHILWRR